MQVTFKKSTPNEGELSRWEVYRNLDNAFIGIVVLWQSHSCGYAPKSTDVIYNADRLEEILDFVDEVYTQHRVNGYSEQVERDLQEPTDAATDNHDDLARTVVLDRVPELLQGR